MYDTGVPANFFEILLAHLAPELSKWTWTTWGLQESKGTTHMGRFSVDSQLFVFLRWMRHHAAQQYIASDLGCNQSTVSRNCMRLLLLTHCLFRGFKVSILFLFLLVLTTEQVVSLPPRKVRKQFYNIVFDGWEVAVLVDGHHQQIPRPGVSKQVRIKHWSGKAGDYTLLLLIFVSPTGMVYYITPSYPGNVFLFSFYYYFISLQLPL